jgi:hypothetical protein
MNPPALLLNVWIDKPWEFPRKRQQRDAEKQRPAGLVPMGPSLALCRALWGGRGTEATCPVP